MGHKKCPWRPPPSSILADMDYLIDRNWNPLFAAPVVIDAARARGTFFSRALMECHRLSRPAGLSTGDSRGSAPSTKSSSREPMSMAGRLASAATVGLVPKVTHHNSKSMKARIGNTRRSFMATKMSVGAAE
jgi:hypothetical protein